MFFEGPLSRWKPSISFKIPKLWPKLDYIDLFCQIYFNIELPFKSRFSKCHFPLRISGCFATNFPYLSWMISVSPIWLFLVSLTYISNILLECCNCEAPYNNCVGPSVSFLVIMFFYGYGKLKWSRYRPDVAQRVGTGIALLFHDRGSRKEWVVSSTSRPYFTPGKDSVPILQEAGWAPGPVWCVDMVGKIISFHAQHFY